VRAVVMGFFVCIAPVAALAQTPAAPAAPSSTPSLAAAPTTAPRRGGDITRDQYVERAKQAAERRFDAMDADHDGVLTADERRAYRQEHSRRRRGAAPASNEPQPAKPQ